MALWVNDKGEAVGMSGSCANTLVPPFAIGPHAVLWKKDGSVHDLGNLGGTANPNVLGAGNVAFAINNRSQITGVSVLPDGVNYHAFLWTASTGMQDLGTLPGDNISAGLGINNAGDVAGASIAGPDPLAGAPKAVIWHNGVIADLNELAPDSPLYLLTAFALNDAGEIAGFGVQLSSGEVHGFLAVPRKWRGDGQRD
jgi:probable HAF family extracellular repeat protein